MSGQSRFFQTRLHQHRDRPSETSTIYSSCLIDLKDCVLSCLYRLQGLGSWKGVELSTSRTLTQQLKSSSLHDSKHTTQDKSNFESYLDAPPNFAVVLTGCCITNTATRPPSALPEDPKAAEQNPFTGRSHEPLKLARIVASAVYINSSSPPSWYLTHTNPLLDYLHFYHSISPTCKIVQISRSISPQVPPLSPPLACLRLMWKEGEVAVIPPCSVSNYNKAHEATPEGRFLW